LRVKKARWFRSGRLGVNVGRVVPFSETAEAGELTKLYEGEVRRLIELGV
jgi:hypothetical protein